MGVFHGFIDVSKEKISISEGEGREGYWLDNIGARSRPPQNVPLWPVEYIRAENNQTPEDSERNFNIPTCTHSKKRNLDGGPGKESYPQSYLHYNMN